MLNPFQKQNQPKPTGGSSFVRRSHGCRVWHHKPAFVRQLEREGKVAFTPMFVPDPDTGEMKPNKLDELWWLDPSRGRKVRTQLREWPAE